MYKADLWWKINIKKWLRLWFLHIDEITMNFDYKKHIYTLCLEN